MTMVVWGTLQLLVSVKGFFGALWERKRVLLVYFSLILVLLSGLIFGASVCFVFKDKADEVALGYIERLRDTPYSDEVLGKYKEDTGGFVHDLNRHLGAAGAVFSVGAVVILVALWSASALMGHKYTLRKSSQIMNFVTLVMGGIVVYLAIASKVSHVGGTWVPGLLGTAGGITVAVSFVGFVGISHEKRGCMWAHLATLVLVILLFIATAVAAFAFSEQTGRYVDAHWDSINRRIVGGKSQGEVKAWIEANLIIIGIAAALLTILDLPARVMDSAWVCWGRWSNGAGWVEGVDAFNRPLGLPPPSPLELHVTARRPVPRAASCRPSQAWGAVSAPRARPSGGGPTPP